MLDWNTALRAELDRAIVQGSGRWSRALMAVAWIHLITFLACQFLHDPLVERDVRHLVLWFVELAVVILTMRSVAGIGWFWSPPAINVDRAALGDLLDPLVQRGDAERADRVGIALVQGELGNA